MRSFHWAQTCAQNDCTLLGDYCNTILYEHHREMSSIRFQFPTVPRQFARNLVPGLFEINPWKPTNPTSNDAKGTVILSSLSPPSPKMWPCLAWVLAIFFLVNWAHASWIDVVPPPAGNVLAQCAQVTLVWSQPPPIHLHVQPNMYINVTNLRDLGVQNDTFMLWTVNLPVDGQNFSFAYNTLADQYVVFQSDGMFVVGQGSTSCMNDVPPSTPTTSTSTKPPSTGISPQTSPSAPASSPSATPSPFTGSSSTSSITSTIEPSSPANFSTSAFPVSGPVQPVKSTHIAVVAAGATCGSITLIAIIGLLVWNRRQRRKDSKRLVEPFGGPSPPQSWRPIHAKFGDLFRNPNLNPQPSWTGGKSRNNPSTSTQVVPFTSSSRLANGEIIRYIPDEPPPVYS